MVNLPASSIPQLLMRTGTSDGMGRSSLFIAVYAITIRVPKYPLFRVGFHPSALTRVLRQLTSALPLRHRGEDLHDYHKKPFPPCPQWSVPKVFSSGMYSGSGETRENGFNPTEISLM